MGAQTFVIGDIHGNLDALKEVLEKAPLKPNDRLIFLGDYGDGFEHTSEVVDVLLALMKKYECLFLQGNHDYWVQDWFHNGTRNLIWTEQGGQATIESYIQSAKIADEWHIAFWDNLISYFISEDNDLFVHGGWDGSRPFKEAAEVKMSNGHLDIHWDRSLVGGTGGKFTKEFRNIFIGHTSTKDNLPFNSQNVWDIDTGAGWSGKLTIMNVETKEYWQSKKNVRSGR